jgi:hypothetical protein
MLAILVALALTAVTTWPLVRRRLQPRRRRREPLTLGRPAQPAPVAKPERRWGRATPRAVQSADPASPPAADVAPVATDEPASPADPTRRWFAEVRWDETAATPRFRVAARATGNSAEQVIAESEPVEWPPPNPEAFRHMADAAQALSDALVQAGWTPVARGEGWYAARFVWEPADTAPTDAAGRALRAAAEREAPASPTNGEPPARTGRFRRETWPAETQALWRCEIRWRRGWLESHFEAMAHDPAGASRPVASWDSFKGTMRAGPDPIDVRARAAVRALRDTLVADGWNRVEPGAPWYAERFVWRRGGTPPDHTGEGTPISAAGT